MTDTSSLMHPSGGGSLMRRIKVTLGLSAVSAVAGALVGALSLLPLVLIEGEAQVAAFVLTLGAALGAPLGLIVGPFLAWRLLRDVPIWRVVLEPAAGALAGGLAVLALLSVVPVPVSLGAIIGTTVSLPLLGAAAAALRLRRSVDRSSKSTDT